MNDTERRKLIQAETVKFLVEQMNVNEPESKLKTRKSQQAKSTHAKITAKQVNKEAKSRAASLASKKIDDLCKPGQLINGRFRITKKLCDGGFGQIYKVYDERLQLEIALKVEQLGYDNTENMETHMLKKCQGVNHFPKYYGSGATDQYTFVAMQLLGKNLTELRHMCHLKPQRFSTSASVRIILQCLISLESIHGMGYLHRDVKPSNLAIGGNGHDLHVIYMFDFGLCRYYLTTHNTVKPPRTNVGFRGTVRYASLNTHCSRELSRRDDVLSWYYSFYELTTGQLPWRQTNDRKVVGQLKSKFTPKVLSETMPKGTEVIAEHLGTLKYESQPNYEYLAESLNQVLHNVNGAYEDVYDWLIDNCKSLNHWDVTSSVIDN